MIRRFAIAESSMEPALSDGDYVITVPVRSVARGQVVVFEHPSRPGFYLVKRVVGLPGEQLTIENGDVFIDGVRFDDPWTTVATSGDGSWTITEGTAFVLGDLRTMSSDSRTLGPIPIARCRRVTWRYWPRPAPIT